MIKVEKVLLSLIVALFIFVTCLSLFVKISQNREEQKRVEHAAALFQEVADSAYFNYWTVTKVSDGIIRLEPHNSPTQRWMQLPIRELREFPQFAVADNPKVGDRLRFVINKDAIKKINDYISGEISSLTEQDIYDIRYWKP